MKRYEIHLPSSDGETNLHGYRWEPEGEARFVVQLVHGMQEHIARYDAFATFLTEQGIAVVGHDHLGHGQSVTSEDKLGYFSDENGHVCVLRDMHRMTGYAKLHYPGKPVIMLAHSMGSFFARRYVTAYPDELDGLILSGTGQMPYAIVRMGYVTAKSIAAGKGELFRSRLLDRMAFGTYGPLERWLCRNRSVVEDYKADPLCGFLFTAGGFRDFFRVLMDLAKEKDFSKLRKDLPVLFIAGMLDPVGSKSKGVLAAYNQLVALGLTDVDIYLYKDDAHEVLNERDKGDVYLDVLRWLEARFS